MLVDEQFKKLAAEYGKHLVYIDDPWYPKPVNS
jgi:hypothetical protein